MLVTTKRDYGDIEVSFSGSYTGSDIIDEAIVYNDRVVLINSNKQSYLLKFKEAGVKDDV